MSTTSTTPTTTTTTTTNEQSNDNTLLAHWQRNLAMILSNKSPDRQSLVATLSDRLLSENQDIMGAHFAYVCGGQLPSAPGGSTTSIIGGGGGGSVSQGGRFILLGCDVSDPKHRAIADCISMNAFRLTEILE